MTTSATRIDFSPPDVMVGLQSNEFRLLVTSTGDDPLNLQRVSVQGLHRADFRLGGCAAIGGVLVSLPPGGYCEVIVTFRPTGPGSRLAALAIQSDDPTQPLVSLPLTGQAIPGAPRLLATPATLDFGTRPLQVTGAPAAFTVLNVGTAPLDVTSVTSDSPEFTVSHDCGLLAAPIPGRTPESCTIQVRFTPQTGGRRDAHVLIASNDPLGTASLPVTGRGAVPVIVVTPSSIDMGSSEVGTSTAGPKTLTIRNDTIPGGPPLDVTMITVSGTNPNDFLRTGSCTVVPAQGSCSLSITFRPRGSGPRSAWVDISSNAGQVVVPLFGFGQFIPVGTWSLPTRSDREFAAFSSGPPTCASREQVIALPIEVTRAFGSRNPVMAPSPPPPGPTVGAALASGALNGTATLDLMVYQVGPSASHTVSLNGTTVGTIAPASDAWVQQRLTLPTSGLTFPLPDPGTGSPSARNPLTILPDRANAGSCLTLAWARLSIKAISPVIFVHGWTSDGGFFVRQGIAGALNSAGIPNDTTIDLPGGRAATVAMNVTALQDRIPAIARAFGADSVHIIAHSKGGLDVRAWLSANAFVNAIGPPRFNVLSVTTLGTPHRGSAGADLLLALDANGIGFGGLTPTSLRSLGFGLTTAATLDLSTGVASAFNPGLPGGVDYRMLGGDADRNFSLTVESLPFDEYAAARSELPFLATLFGIEMLASGKAPATDGLVTFLYRFLYATQSVEVVPISITVGVPPLQVTLLTITAPRFVPSLPAPNDLLVTTQSARGGPPPFVPVFGAFGADHAALASVGVGTSLVPLLLATDLSRGDLR